MSSFAPQIFIIGSQKCGTTSLARLLEENPEICLSEPKEPNYYSVNHERGADWYRSCFAHHDRVLVDASTTYTMCALSERALSLKEGRQRQLGVPRRIFEDRPDARFIYIIRDPVARVYSNYWHNLKHGHDRGTLEQAIERDPQYIHLSEYYGQLQKYLEFFPAEQILVVRFEDFVADQQGVLNRCEAFIGVAQSEVRDTRRENQGQQYSGLGSFLIGNPLTRNADRLLPRALKARIKRLLSSDIPPISDTQAAALRPYFAEDQRQLLDVFGTGYPALCDSQ